MTVKKEKEDLLVNVAVAVIDSDSKEVSLPTGKIVDKLNADTFDIDSDYAKVSDYQYTFTYNKQDKSYYLKSLKRTNPPVKKNIRTIDIDNQSNEVKELYSIITNQPGYYYTYDNGLYQGKTITVQDIDSMYKLFMVYKGESNGDDIINPFQGGRVISKMSKESFEQKYTSFFGEAPTKFTFDNYLYCSSILYDETTESYFAFHGECGGTYESLRTYTDIFSVEETDKDLKISQKVMILTENNSSENTFPIYNLYLDMNRTILINEYTNVDAKDTEDFFEELYNDLPIYTFTFEKQTTGNYVLKTISPNN